MTPGEAAVADPAVRPSESDFRELVEAVHRITGISIKEQRRIMLERRLRRRLPALGLTDYPSYLSRVASDEAERRTFVDLVTTNETYFYRTPRVWEYVERSLLPRWRGARPFRAWSAAASTGEEAHTLGILLEARRRAHPSFDYEIHGTDISGAVIDVARAGVYNGKSIARFREDRPELFARFMTGDDAGGYAAVPEIRRRVRFSTANLFRLEPVTTRYDLVLLRNVLIYFARADQIAVMSHVHERLSPDGVAIIGESESLSYLDTDFEPLEHTVYRPRRERASAA